MALKLLYIKYGVDDTHVCNTHVLYVWGERDWVQGVSLI